MKYEWTPPKLARGDRASFQDHHGRRYKGKCCGVATRYKDSGAAYHIYEMLPDGCKRLRHISGETIYPLALATGGK